MFCLLVSVAAMLREVSGAALHSTTQYNAWLNPQMISAALDTACYHDLEPCPGNCTNPRACMNPLELPSGPKVDGRGPAIVGNRQTATKPLIEYNDTTLHWLFDVLQNVTMVVYDPTWTEKWNTSESYEQVLGKIADSIGALAEVPATEEVEMAFQHQKRGTTTNLPCCGEGNDDEFGCNGLCGPFKWVNVGHRLPHKWMKTNWNKTGIAPCCRIGYEFPFGCTFLCIKKSGDITNEYGRVIGHVPPVWHKWNDWKYHNGTRKSGDTDEISRRDEDLPCCRRDTAYSHGCVFCVSAL